MPAEPSAHTAPRSPYAEFMAELDEIQRHKWHLSEREGADIGFERALNDWALNHREAWRRVRNLWRDQAVSGT